MINTRQIIITDTCFIFAKGFRVQAAYIHAIEYKFSMDVVDAVFIFERDHNKLQRIMDTLHETN